MLYKAEEKILRLIVFYCIRFALMMYVEMHMSSLRCFTNTDAKKVVPRTPTAIDTN